MSPTSIKLAVTSSTAAQAAQRSSSMLARRLAGWRRRLERRRQLEEMTVQIPGAAADYRIAVPANPDEVLDQMSNVAPHMPYWATLWPSGLALAELVLARRAALSGSKAIELGCGLGITATAAVEAGLQLTVTDVFPETLAYCQYNVLRNTGCEVTPLLVNWRSQDGQRRLAARLRDRLVLAADVLYEPEDIEPLVELLGSTLDSGGMFWLAEPGRTTSTRFVALAHERGWHAETVEMERHWPGTAGYAHVRLHLFGSP